MSRADLKRLEWLGEKRKEMALKKVAARQTAMQRAEAKLSEAREAVSERMRSASEQEAQNLSQMIGKTLSYADITNFNSNRGALVNQLDELRATERAAREKCDNAKSDLNEANAVFRRHSIRAEKLQHLIKHQTRKFQHKTMTLSEASDDEFLSRHTRTAPDGSQSM